MPSPATDLQADIAVLLSVPLPYSRLEKLANNERSANRSALLGAYTRQGIGVCRHTSQVRYRPVLAAAHRIASARSLTAYPYTSISINEGACAAHRDQNWGPTVVFAAGEYQGGDLLIQADEKRKEEIDREERLHHVRRHSGVRRSLSFFVARGPERLSTDHWVLLHRWGFPTKECIQMLRLGVVLPSLPEREVQGCTFSASCVPTKSERGDLVKHLPDLAEAQSSKHEGLSETKTTQKKKKKQKKTKRGQGQSFEGLGTRHGKCQGHTILEEKEACTFEGVYEPSMRTSYCLSCLGAMGVRRHTWSS
eukprot:4901513-Amphidinium_carterae.1